MSGVLLSGLAGHNPMAFLAALGALSLAGEEGRDVRLRWERHGGRWGPVLEGDGLADEGAVLEALAAAHARRDLAAELGWAKDVLAVPRETARQLLRDRLEGDGGAEDDADRLLAAMVCELPLRRLRDEQVVPYTRLRLIPRLGRTRFLGAALKESARGPRALRACLFEEWRYVRDVQSLRWDPGVPVSARALTAEAPTHLKPRGVPGATLLAVRGLAFFPLMTAGRAAVPPGVVRRGGTEVFVWPIWDSALSAGAIRILLGMPWLRSDAEDAAARRRAHGVVARFVAERVVRGDDDEAWSWGEERLLPDAPRSPGRSRRSLTTS